MDKRHKDIMNALVGKLRHILVGTPTDNGFKPGDLDRELERLGIDRDGVVTPIDALDDIHNGDGQTYRIVATQLNRLPQKERKAARRDIVERAAYTWINRLLALRAMEVRGLIDDTLRVSEDYGGLSEKLYLLRMDSPASATEADGGWWIVLKEACAELAKALPGLFALDDPDTSLHPTAGALIQCIELIGGKVPVLVNVTLEELDATFADPDAIGWAYQFYQAEAKSEIDAKCKIGGKAASRAELAAKTQLFTEPYMVQWLLQNSLGRSYIEFFPQSTLPASWPYYIQPEQTDTPPEKIFPLEELTLLDPCMGSGHFLRAAFDMFVSMYRELHPEMSAVEIANRILGQHLYGIDLDPRAAQLSALTLYLRAWEIVKAERRSGDMSLYIPPEEMHLATTPTNLDRGALERHIQRYPDDMVYKPLLEKVFEGLEQADTLGSLLRSREYLDQAIADLQRPHTVSMDFSQAEADLRRDVTVLARSGPVQLRQMLLDRIAASFHSEANRTDDVSMALFGREAERGVRLLQVLDGHYAVVVTNPPYLGSKHMNQGLKKYVTTHYKVGKRDLYSAFILRCLDLCNARGRVAMVTMQGWMFLSSFADLRSLSEGNFAVGQRKVSFTGILRETSIEALVHLGTNAFEEISGEVVQSAMFTLANYVPSEDHKMMAFRLVGLKATKDKSNILTLDTRSNYQTFATQADLLIISNTPILYWLGLDLIKLLTNKVNLGQFVDIRQGMATADNERFLRYLWETLSDDFNIRWKLYAKGGGYRKWIGFEELCFDYRSDGSYFRAYESEKFAGTQWDGILGRKFSLVERYMQQPCLVYTEMARGSMGPRFWPGGLFDVKSIAIHHKNKLFLLIIAGILSSRYTSYILRSITQNLEFHAGYAAKLPLKPNFTEYTDVAKLVEIATHLKLVLMSLLPTERVFTTNTKQLAQTHKNIECLLCVIENHIEVLVNQHLELTSSSLEEIYKETGMPAGWYPLITNYDSLPGLSEDLGDLPELPQELYNYLAEHERITPEVQELARIKTNLRTLYEAGPGAKGVELEESTNDKESEDDEELTSGAHIPIPTETFLEELSVKMQLHPISVYWLLEELRATEMVRCLPEERRLLEDRLSVLVLRLLGHRWPKQIEAFEPVPDWARRDGIIPMVSGTGHKTLAEHLRERLYVEEGALGAQEVEAHLRELTKKNLEEWLHSTFFERHSSQFKKRPVAWHLASTPPKRNAGDKKKYKDSSGPRTPAFECMLYYHVCAGDALARIRTQYVEPLLQNERGKIDTTTLFTEDRASAFTQERIHELEEFVARLRVIEERGFACHELQEIVAEEVLDRWSGDGYRRPEHKEAFQRGEEAWHVDINDGVRVNIAPLQLAGVLSKEVLNTKDAKKTLRDRVQWRSDERRWVREGKLPRCGWMDELVPASQAWEERKTQPASGRHQQQLTLLPEAIDQDQEEVRP